MAEVADDTAVLPIVNFPVEALAVTVTVAGIVIALELVDSFTTVATRTGAARVTTPAALVPPITVVGLITTLLINKGVTVRFTVGVELPKVAFNVTVVAEATTKCVRVNVAVVAPLATFTEAGTVTAAVFELPSVTA